MSNQGFFYLIGHGYSKEQMERMFDIADVPFSQVGDQEKEKYLASMKQAGSYQGYKLRRFWHVDNGVLDQVETYNSKRPPTIPSYLDCLSMNVLARLMALGLELPEETLLDMHSGMVTPKPTILGLLYSQVASPVLQRLGIKRRFERDEDAPVMAEWRKATTAPYGQSVLSKSTEERDVEQEVIQGVVVLIDLTVGMPTIPADC
ncbi:hypothetical protein DFJ43DRAFT_1044312 [Lentinula guzmanii]|uniref:Non-haem dioxygenase N-terminal domain-containing protein n=1 Tax=Lentinula guzmanii TaxID=2804957 RepID=A0AA38J2J8_9AGAR|nr:hypothetical protein DFJ43DRAFT_1044312 [Lentinula guzmanii]